MWASLVGVAGRIFGTDKAIDNVLDKDKGLLVRAGGWIDGFSYTDQEKAEANKETREWGLRQLTALEPFKVVQRIIAFATLGIWAFVAINVVAAIWIESIFPAIKIVAPMAEFAYSDYVFWPALLVLSFYMSGGVLPQLVGKNKGVQQQ